MPEDVKRVYVLNPMIYIPDLQTDGLFCIQDSRN